MNNEQDLLDYLIGKSFEELSKREKEIVLNQISEEEFNRLRETHLLIKKAINKEQKEVKPSSEVKTLLLKKFRKKHKKENPVLQTLKLLLNYKIPIYQPTLLLALVFIYLFIIRQNRPGPFEGNSNPIADLGRSKPSSPQKLTSQDSITDFMADTLENLSARETLSVVTEQRVATLADKKDNSIGIFDAKEAQISSMTLKDDSLLAVFFTSIK